MNGCAFNYAKEICLGDGNAFKGKTIGIPLPSGG